MNTPVPPPIYSDSNFSSGNFNGDLVVAGTIFASAPSKFSVAVPSNFGGNGVLVPFDIFNGLVKCCVSTDSIVTFCTAADLVAEAKVNYGTVAVGDAWRIKFSNAGSGDNIKLAAGTGVTIVNQLYTTNTTDDIDLDVMVVITNVDTGTEAFSVY